METGTVTMAMGGDRTVTVEMGMGM